MSGLRGKKALIISWTGYLGFFLALAPILDPYVLMQFGGVTVKVNDIIMLFLAAYCFAKSSGFEMRTNFLCFWVCILVVISLIGNLGSGTNLIMSMKNLLVWFVFAFCLSYIWKNDCGDEFFYWVEKIAVFACALVVLQFLFGNIGIPMWDGKIPGISLSKYDTWSGYIDCNTGDIRPNGLFQEASYLGIYVSVAYVHAFKEENVKKLLLYAVGMLLTTSMVAIILCATITAYFLVKHKKVGMTSKMFNRMLLMSLIAIILGIILIQTNEYVKETYAYIMRRINNLENDLIGERMSSAKIRLLGNIGLFGQYNSFQKIFGVGAGQYASYFGVISYSNVWVTTLLNFGILGIVTLIFSLITFAMRVHSKHMIYVVVLILVLSSDYQWFSWYFFYLISACILPEYTDDY